MAARTFSLSLLRHRRLAEAPAWTVTALLTLAVAAPLYASLAVSMAHAVLADRAAGGALYLNGDFATMWKAGLLVRAGGGAALYNRHLFDLWLQRRFGGAPVDESWLYTPPMTLLAVLVSLAPLPAAFWAWRVVTLAVAAVLLRVAGLGTWVVAAGLLGPAEAYDLLLGQNGLLTAGLLVAAVALMERHPGRAGCLAGCLIVKPQIAILLPFVVLHRRRRRAALACAGTAAALAVLAAFVLGARAWPLFFTLAQPNAGRILRIPFGGSFQMSAFTVFYTARSLHAGLGLAWGCQALASDAAAIGCWWLWRRPGADPAGRLAATVCLSALAMPYGFSYDLVGFSLAVAVLVPRAAALELPLLALLWFTPCLTTAFTLATGVEAMPLAVLAGLAVALRRVISPPWPAPARSPISLATPSTAWPMSSSAIPPRRR